MNPLLDILKGYADCRRRRVGAVITKDGAVVAVGWNALPGDRSCLLGDCPRGLLSYEEVPASADYSGNCDAEHAEVAAIRRAGEDAAGASMVISDEPCPGCREAIVAAEIAEVTWPGSTWRPQIGNH